MASRLYLAPIPPHQYFIESVTYATADALNTVTLKPGLGSH